MLDPQTSLDSIFFPIPSFMAWKGLDPWVSMWLPIGTDPMYPWDQPFNTFYSCYVIFPSFYPHDSSSWGNLHHSAVDNNFFLLLLLSMLVVTTKVLSFFVTAGNSRNLTPHSTCRSLPTFQDVLVHVWRCFFPLKRCLSRDRISYQICWWCPNFMKFPSKNVAAGVIPGIWDKRVLFIAHKKVKRPRVCTMGFN